jgi:hypothetical protein
MITMICITIIAIALAGYFARRAWKVEGHRIVTPNRKNEITLKRERQ